MVCGLEGGSYFQTVAVESMTFELRLEGVKRATGQ